MSVTAGALQQGLTAAQAMLAAVGDKLGSLSLDEAAVVDLLQVASWFDPTLLPLVAASPAIELLVNLLATNNQSGSPGSEMPINWGRKGSDPWLSG